MKFHGLVFLTVVSLATPTFAQTGSPGGESGFPPPAPQKFDAASGEPSPLPLAPPVTEPGQPVPARADAALSASIELELKQFRNELREFQAVREEVARNSKATEDAADHLSSHQRQELMTLLTKLAKQNLARKNAGSVPPPNADPVLPKSAPSVPTPEATVTPQPTIDVDPVTVADPFALGKVLFRSGDFVGAEKAFRKAAVTSENEMMIKYLLATCLRRQSRWKPAIETYKLVAESNQDPVLRDLAKWQLDNIRWHQQSEVQMEQLRQQREKKSEPVNSPSASTATTKQ